MKNLLIVAQVVEGHSLAQKPEIQKTYHLVAIVSDHDSVSYLIGQSKVDIILIGSTIEKQVKEEIIAIALEFNIRVWIIPGLYEIMLSQAPIHQVGDSPVFEIRPIELEVMNKYFKRTMDITIAFLAILIFLPLLILLAVLVKIDSPGKPIFSQNRVSLGGKEFTLYKFRTMIEKAEEGTGPVLAKKNDPRITRVGRFLRSTRLDELPQLFNVLLGPMSMVGPRPERPHFVNKFVKEIPHYSYRLKVKSGITGLAQVAGKYSTSPEDKLKYDLLYIKQYSLLKDIQIIIRTFKVLMMKDKAS